MSALRTVLAGTLLAAAVPSLHSEQSAHAFVDVAVVPMSREVVLEHQTVLVEDGRITRIDHVSRVAVPASATSIDGRGKFLIPGLGDAHVHLSTPGGSPELAERGITLLALNGVTMARSMYTDPHHQGAAMRVREGTLLGPQLQLVSPPLSGQTASTPAAAAAAVRQRAAAGDRIIKILPGLSRESFDSAAAQARSLGLLLVGHVPVEVGLKRALASGYLSIEHLDGILEELLPADSPVPPSRGGFFGFGLLDAIDERKISAVVGSIRASGVTLVPTESGMEAFVSMDSAEQLARCPEMRFVPPALIAQWTQQKAGFVRGVGVTSQRSERYRELRRRMIRELDSAGVPLALGSDGWSMFHVPGFSTLLELEIYVASGLSPYRALRTATVNVARLMGLEEGAGSIVDGGPADLVLLEANPLVDISAVRRQAGVMIRGQWLSRSELDRRLAELSR